MKHYLTLFLITLVAYFCALACKPSQTPREQMRAVVVTVADGVRQADITCASMAKSQKSITLADECNALYVEAREQLLTAEDLLDAWSDISAERLPCAVRTAADALARITSTVTRAGGRVSPAVEDALRLAPTLAGACHDRS